MRNSFLLILLTSVTLNLTSSVSAAEDPESGGAKEKIIDVVKASDDKEELEAGLKKAKAKSGATEQQILEGKILWAVLRVEDVDYFQTIAGDAEKAAHNWKSGEAVMLKKSKQIMGMIHFMAALKAHQGGDAATAQKELLAAIWLDPSMDKYVAAIKKIQPIDMKIPMDTKIPTVDGKKVSLSEFVKGNKALYIQIWATWCGPCVKLFPVLSARAKVLPPQGVAVIALNSELGRESGGGGNIAKAKEWKLNKNMQLPWLIEPAGSPYTELLEIDSVPRAIIVDPAGNVLFNEHPMDSGLTLVMKNLGVTKFDLNAGKQAD